MNYYLLDSIKIDGDMEKNLTVMQKWLNEAGEWIIGFIPNIIAAVIFLIAGYWLIKLIVHIIHKALEKGNADHTIISFLVSVSRASLAIMLGVCILATLGVNVATLLAALGAAAVTVGLAIKDSLANVACGTLIILNRKFKTGDFIETEGIIGEIMRIDIMYTTLRTYDHKEVLIPNSRLASNNVINHFKLDDRRLEIHVPVSYSQDIGQARKVVMDYIATVKGVLQDKPNRIIVNNYGDSSVDMILYVWCNSNEYWPVLYEVMDGVKAALDKAGIEIPFNQLDVHFDSGILPEPEQKKSEK